MQEQFKNAYGPAPHFGKAFKERGKGKLFQWVELQGVYLVVYLV